MRKAESALLAVCLLVLSCRPDDPRAGLTTAAGGALSVTDGVPFAPASGAATLRAFGGAVALSGGTLLVATGYMEISVTGDPGYVGPVYVFVHSGNDWVEQARLAPAEFGYRS